MAATYPPEPSGILSLLLFAAVCSPGITRPERDSDIPTVTTTLQDYPEILTKSIPQNPSTFPAASGDLLPSPPHSPEVLADRRQPWTIKTENKRTIRLADFELPTRSTKSHTEVLMNDITETVWSVGHADRARYIRETFDPEAAGEASKDPQIIRNATTFLSAFPSSSSAYTSNPAENSPSEISTFGNMYLCDHPPKTFSPSFFGSSWEACLQYDRKWEESFRDTMELCKKVYSWTETNLEARVIGHYQSDVGTMKVITHESYVRICLPLFRRFNKCEERNFLTICWEDRVVFFHSNTCPYASSDVFLAGFLLDNNTECFTEFCEGRQSVVDAEVGGLMYRLTNVRHSCGYMIQGLKYLYRKYNGTLYLHINDRWPCCYSHYVVIWAGLPEAHGLNGAWSYLPVSCQAGEVLLLVLVGCVMAGSIGGNLLVLVVMLRGGHRSQESSLLRTSLAFADMLTATFVIVPSFMQHLKPFFFPPNYSLLTPGMKLAFESISVTSYTNITDFNRRNGFPVFQSVLFNTTSTASLLTLLVLSVERFVITGRFLRYRDYFSYCRTVFVIAVSWTTSLVNALWFAAHDDGGLGAQWLTFEKLPTGASGYGPGGVRNIIYHGQFAIFLLLGISVVTFSALAIWNFVREQLHVAKEWRSLKMKASKQYSRDNRYVLTTMMLMLILFLTSTLPLATNIVFNSVTYNFRQHTLFSYLAWWLFMAGSAWNPWVYNFRSRQFKEDLTNFQRQVLRAWRWQRLRAEEPQPLPATSLSSESS